LYKVISLSGTNENFLKCGYPIARSGNIFGSVTNANLSPGDACEFNLTTQLKTNSTSGLVVNTACLSGVKGETSGYLSNNCGSDAIHIIKACPNLSVTPDFGDNPLLTNFRCSLSGTTSGYIQILNNRDILLKNYTTLSGSHLFSGVGYYYIECVSPQFT